MSLENTRNIELALSKGNVNDAFTSLLLMTGHLNEGEVITDVKLGREPAMGPVPVSITISKEVQASRPD